MKKKYIFENNLKCLSPEVREAMLAYRVDNRTKIRGSSHPILVHGDYRSGQTAEMEKAYKVYADKFVKSVKLSAEKGIKRSMFIFGFLDGYLIESLIKTGMPTKTYYLAVPDLDNMRLMLMERDMRATLSSPKLKILIGTDKELSDEFLNICTIMEKHTDFCPHEQFRMFLLHTGLYPHIMNCFHHVMAEVRYSAGERDVIRKNMLANLICAKEDHGIKELFGTKKGKIVFIVAPGPSIDVNIEKLRGAKAEAPDAIDIVAVGQACRTLRKQGVKPDYIVYHDFSELAINHFPPEHKEWAKGIPFIYDQETYHEIVEMHDTRYFAFDVKARMRVDEFEELSDRGTFDHAGNISTNAFGLAAEMGYDQIWLWGVDLGYPDDEKTTHSADYSMKGQEKLYEDHAFLTNQKTMGVLGKEIKTSYFLDADGGWMERFIKERNLDVINMGLGRYLRGAHNVYSGEGTRRDFIEDTIKSVEQGIK